MYSNRSEYGHSRQYNDRSSRQWDGYDDTWEDRHESHRGLSRDSHHKYVGDGHSSTGRTSRSREYSDSPKRLYSRDSLNRDRSRRSPVRRRMSSPDWGASEKKRRRYTEGGEDDYKYRRMPEDKASRRSSDSFPHSHVSKDFKRTQPPEEDIKYRKTTQDSRHRYRHEDSTYRQQQDDSAGRRSSGYYKDRDGHERSWDHSKERTRSQDRSTESYAKPREGNDSPSIDHEAHLQNRTRFLLNSSSGQSYESDATQKKPTKGFQRFLDVLNKGVNVSMLTKIVTQNSTGDDDRLHSPTSFMNIVDRPWSPSGAGRQQESQQNTSHWSESQGLQKLASPPPRHMSFSPKVRSLTNEKSLLRADGERSCFSSSGRSGSPSMVERTPPTPEDEHKHRQIQDVLQAIGMNLGFEELGQMSHRIQERLYGKKDGDGGHNRRGSRERNTRQEFSPRQQSRSASSSRSSLSPPTREYDVKKDSFNAERDVTEYTTERDVTGYSPERNVTEVQQIQVHQAVEYDQNSSINNLQENENCETNSQENTAPCQTFSQHPSYTLPEPSPPPVMPMYPPLNFPTQAYPPLPPNLSLSLPANLPPNLPPVGPGLLWPRLPRLPPLLPYAQVPPLNKFPAVLAQTRHLLPPHVNNPPPFLNLPIQPVNTTQKSKPLSRPRCLQVIETKQPG